MSDPISHSTYPYKFNETEIPFPAEWGESFSRVVNKNTSEAGEDIEIIVRRGKLSVSARCNGLSSLKKTIEQFYNMDNFTLSRYDDITEAYKTHNVRMTEFSANRIYKSESVNDTVGLWKISFKLEEF